MSGMPTTRLVSIMSIQTHSAVERDASNDELCLTVVNAVADAKGVDPLDLEESLHDVIDPDALEDLFAPRFAGVPRFDGRVSFTMADCTVVVESGGRVVVSPPE